LLRRARSCTNRRGDDTVAREIYLCKASSTALSAGSARPCWYASSKAPSVKSSRAFARARALEPDVEGPRSTPPDGRAQAVGGSQHARARVAVAGGGREFRA